MNRIALLPLALTVACVESEMDVETETEAISASDLEIGSSLEAVEGSVGITGGPIARMDQPSDPFSAGFDGIADGEPQQTTPGKPLNRLFDPEGYCATDAEVERSCPAITDELVSAYPEVRADLIELKMACDRFMRIGPDHYALVQDEVVVTEGSDEERYEAATHVMLCNGAPVEAYDLIDEGIIPAEQAKSVDKVFHLIAAMLTSSGADLEITYDSNMGAPTSITASRVEGGQMVHYSQEYAMLPIGILPE
jgi:hypothetical protein